MVVILMISRFSFKSSLFYIQWSGRWPLLAIKVKTAIIHFGKRLLHSICSLGKTTGWITFAAPRHHSGWNLPLKSHFSHSPTLLIIKCQNCQKSRSLRSLDFDETFFGDLHHCAKSADYLRQYPVKFHGLPLTIFFLYGSIYHQLAKFLPQHNSSSQSVLTIIGRSADCSISLHLPKLLIYTGVST